jgi:hypothetical protein
MYIRVILGDAIMRIYPEGPAKREHESWQERAHEFSQGKFQAVKYNKIKMFHEYSNYVLTQIKYMIVSGKY